MKDLSIVEVIAVKFRRLRTQPSWARLTVHSWFMNLSYRLFGGVPGFFVLFAFDSLCSGAVWLRTNVLFRSIE